MMIVRGQFAEAYRAAETFQDDDSESKLGSVPTDRILFGPAEETHALLP